MEFFMVILFLIVVIGAAVCIVKDPKPPPLPPDEVLPFETFFEDIGISPVHTRMVLPDDWYIEVDLTGGSSVRLGPGDSIRPEIDCLVVYKNVVLDDDDHEQNDRYLDWDSIDSIYVSRPETEDEKFCRIESTPLDELKPFGDETPEQEQLRHDMYQAVADETCRHKLPAGYYIETFELWRLMFEDTFMLGVKHIKDEEDEASVFYLQSHDELLEWLDDHEPEWCRNHEQKLELMSLFKHRFAEKWGKTEAEIRRRHFMALVNEASTECGSGRLTKEKLAKLQANGWKVGGTEDFLGQPEGFVFKTSPRPRTECGAVHPLWDDRACVLEPGHEGRHEWLNSTCTGVESVSWANNDEPEESSDE